MQLVKRASSRAFWVGSELFLLDSRRFGVLSRGDLGPVGAFFVRARAFSQNAPRIELVLNSGPKLMVS